jgi:hypothetical protein
MRKSLKELSWDVSEEVYRADSALSYSRLSQFHKNGPKALISTEKIDTPALRFGSLVDTILTAPEEFDDKFYVADIDRFSDTIRKIVEDVHNSYKQMGWELKDELSESPEEMLLQSLDWAEYQSNWKPETRIKKLIELGSDYYTVLKYSTGKIVITQQELEEAQQCVQTLRTHPWTYQIFECDEDEEILYQLKFKTELGGVSVRIMMDLVKCNHKTKKIKPFDLKTTGGSEEKFEESYEKWCYWIQSPKYKKVLQKVIGKDDYFKDFTVEDFEFIVINKQNLSPLRWLDIDSPENRELLFKKYGVTWQRLLLDANWHLQNGKFDYSRKSYENKGVNTIQLKL